MTRRARSGRGWDAAPPRAPRRNSSYAGGGPDPFGDSPPSGSRSRAVGGVEPDGDLWEGEPFDAHPTDPNDDRAGGADQDRKGRGPGRSRAATSASASGAIRRASELGDNTADGEIRSDGVRRGRSLPWSLDDMRSSGNRPAPRSQRASARAARGQAVPARAIPVTGRLRSQRSRWPGRSAEQSRSPEQSRPWWPRRSRPQRSSRQRWRSAPREPLRPSKPRRGGPSRQ